MEATLEHIDAAYHASLRRVIRLRDLIRRYAGRIDLLPELNREEKKMLRLRDQASRLYRAAAAK